MIWSVGARMKADFGQPGDSTLVEGPGAGAENARKPELPEAPKILRQSVAQYDPLDPMYEPGTETSPNQGSRVRTFSTRFGKFSQKICCWSSVNFS